MASGVGVDASCLDAYKDLQKKKLHRYILFKLSPDLKNIIVDYRGGKDESYDDFVQKLIEAADKHEGRYAVFDCAYAAEKANKIVFLMWLPDNSLGTKQKMLYTTSKRDFKNKLQGVAQEMQCNDLDDLAWSAMVEKCQSKYD